MNIIKGHWQHFHYPLNCAKLKLQIENTINGNISISNNQLPYIANLVSKAGSMISESEWKSHKAKYGDPYSEFVLYIYLVHTHTSEHTHTPWTHTQSSGQPFMLRRPGSSWGFGALLKGTSVMVSKVERALYIHSPRRHACDNPETRTRNLSIMNLALYH